MAIINWVNANTSGISAGSNNKTAALEQASRSFARFNNQLNVERGLDAEDAAVQKVEDDRNKLLTNQSSAADFRKAFFSNNAARFDDKSLIKALESSPKYKNASPEQQEAAKARYLESLGDTTIRRAEQFSSEYESFLRGQGMLDADIRAEVATAVQDQFPTSSAPIRKELRELVEYQFEGGRRGSGGSRSGSGKSTGITQAETGKLLGALQTQFDLPDGDSTLFGKTFNNLNPFRLTSNNPSVASLNRVVSFMSSNGVSAEGIRNTLPQIMNANGTVKDSFDFSNQEGQAKLLDFALNTSNGRVSNGNGSDDRQVPQNVINKLESIIGTASPQNVSSQSIADTLSSFITPQPRQEPFTTPLVEPPQAVAQNLEQATFGNQNQGAAQESGQIVPEQQGNVLDSLRDFVIPQAQAAAVDANFAPIPQIGNQAPVAEDVRASFAGKLPAAVQAGATQEQLLATAKTANNREEINKLFAEPDPREQASTETISDKLSRFFENVRSQQ